jgi:hypothetical protein
VRKLIGENRTRFIIVLVWLVCFIGMWLIFSAVLPKEEFTNHLNQIEKSASNKDWDKAKNSMSQLRNIYDNKRAVIQMNNATEILTTFDLAMGQLEASVEHEQEAALEYVGALKSTLDFVLKAFSGP